MKISFQGKNTYRELNTFSNEERRNNKVRLSLVCVEGRMLERHFQGKLIKEIKQRLNGCIVLKTDPNYIQGLPDLLVLHKNKWAALEVKKSKTASHRPNQDYYIKLMNEMSFARFISPEVKEEVLDELCKALQPKRSTRSSRRK